MKYYMGSRCCGQALWKALEAVVQETVTDHCLSSVMGLDAVKFQQMCWRHVLRKASCVHDLRSREKRS